MNNQFLNQEKIFVQTTELAKLLMQSGGYADFFNKVVENNIEYNEQKTYEIASTVFVDFNQHLYEDINHMNSISTGIYLEMSLMTYRLFIWSSKGEGFEIFKHVLLGDEIDKLKRIEDIKEYLYIHLKELEEGIVKTYGEDTQKSFEQFGMAIENRQLPLQSILQNISIENNMKDFR